MSLVPVEQACFIKITKNGILKKGCNDFKKEISKDTFNYNANSPEITTKYIYTTSSKATASAATTETATIEQNTIFDEGNNHQFHYYEISSQSSSLGEIIYMKAITFE